MTLGAGGRVEWTGDKADAQVPVVDQQPGGGGSSAGVVDQHGIGVAGVRQRAVDEDDRHTEVGERLRRLGVVAGWCQEQAVHSAADRRQDGVLAVRTLVGVA